MFALAGITDPETYMTWNQQGLLGPSGDRCACAWRSANWAKLESVLPTHPCEPASLRVFINHAYYLLCIIAGVTVYVVAHIRAGLPALGFELG